MVGRLTAEAQAMEAEYAFGESATNMQVSSSHYFYMYF